jgi:RNA polymerase sigma-70 factor (ECF subfamily)
MSRDVTPAEAPAFMNERAPVDAWKICYRELAPKLLLFARQWCSDTADAEDVVQTAFVKFWKRQPDAQREHWPLLYAAVRSTALDHLRGTERRVRREAEPTVSVLREDDTFFDHAVQQHENAALVDGALRELSADQRQILVLRIWGGLTFAEIAATLGESINTVASRYRYALEAMRRQLKPYAHERF